jgi:GntR family transcriptional regulator
MELELSSPIPLHVQLRNILESKILQGEYKERIPSERELMDMYSISRSTVREAVSTLVQEGILQKRQGRGTFVSLKPVVKEWIQLVSFTESSREMGTKLLEHGVVATPDNIQETNSYGNESYCIKRLLLRDGVPIGIELHYYPLQLGQRLSQSNLNSAVLYDVLESDLGVVFLEADQMITCCHPTVEDAMHLGVSQSMCLLVTERMISDPERNIVEYYKGFFRSDKYCFSMKMSRKSL